MTTARTAYVWIVCVLLAAGYAASQVAFFQGETASYARAVDTPAVWIVCWVIVLTGLILWFSQKDGKSL